MTDDALRALRDAHDAAYDLARGCPVYAPKHGTDDGVALYHATKSGATSAARADDWMRLYEEMKARGIVSERHPHLFIAQQGAGKGGE